MPRVKLLTSLKNLTDLIQWHKCCWQIIFNLRIKTTFFPLSLFFSSDTSCWSSLAFPQLNSVPRAGHSIITMPTTCKQVKTFKFKLRRSLSSGFSSLFIIIVCFTGMYRWTRGTSRVSPTNTSGFWWWWQWRELLLWSFHYASRGAKRLNIWSGFGFTCIFFIFYFYVVVFQI